MSKEMSNEEIIAKRIIEADKSWKVSGTAEQGRFVVHSYGAHKSWTYGVVYAQNKAEVRQLILAAKAKATTR